MRAGWLSSGLLAIALGALPLACGAPFTSSTDTTGTSAGGGTSSSTSSTASSTTGAGGTGGATGSGGSSTTGVTTTTGAGTGGQMSDCVVPTDCPGADTECKKRTCNAGTCGFTVTPMSLTASQLWGDCMARACDGQGNLQIVNFPMDFYDDGNACTNDFCKNQVPENKPVSGIVCEGGVCNDSGSCVQCLDGNMCPPLKKNCVEGRCLPVHCVDNLQDVGETDKDCGGECLPCNDGKGCVIAADCQSDVCEGQPKVCKSATCNDGRRNGTETDGDCGGKCADGGQRCSPGQKCKAPNDCTSHVCQAGFCQQALCTDGVKNGNELGVDCGGDCGPCPPPN